MQQDAHRFFGSSVPLTHGFHTDRGLGRHGVADAS
jgi:hypothetical protein